MKRTIIALSVCLGVSPAWATDWALNSTLSQTVELNDNPFLRALAAGAFDSYSTIAANAVARTPTSIFTFDGDVNYRKYWGPGAEGVQSESLSGEARMHYETSEKYSTDREYVDAGWHRQSLQFALLGELGVVIPTTGFLDTTSVGGGIERSITERDLVSLAAHSVYTSYDPGGGGIPFLDSSASGTWRHKVNSIAALTASSEVETLHFDNTLNTNIIILRDNAGVEATLSPRLSFTGTAGVAYVQIDRGSPAVSLAATSANASAPSAAADFITNMVLTYKMFPDTTLTLRGVQTIAPSVVGALTKLTTIGAGLTRTVNSRTTLSFSADASRQILAGSETDFLSTSVTYSYQLAREWTAQLTYRYLHRLAATGTASTGFVIDPVTGVPLPVSTGLPPATSNSIMLVVSRSISILPDGY